MLDQLIPEFKTAVESTIRDCYAAGIEMRPYFTLRSPEQQAKYWRQSRSSQEIFHAIAMLKAEGASYLAHILESVGPQYGKWATNALPGESWHQYGEAVDCVWIKNGASCWKVTDEPNNGYQVYAKMAVKNGLTSLGPSISDWAHIQYSHFNRPDYDWLKIDQLMKARFCND